MRDFVTFALTSVRHSVVHRPKIGEHVKADKEERKESREVGSPDKSIWTDGEGTTVMMCGDSRVADRWIDGCFAMRKKYRDVFGRIQKTTYSWCTKRVGYPVQKIRVFVKPTFKVHI